MLTTAVRHIEPPARAMRDVTSRSQLRNASFGTVSCSTCKSHDMCLSTGSVAVSAPLLDAIVKTRIHLRKGDTLYRAGSRFSALYSIRSGSCKTVLLAEDGHDQVAGYHMAGEIIGIDGMCDERHECEAIALEDSEICVLPFDRITQIANRDSLFQLNLQQLLSREISRERRLMLLLGTMRADQRVATFLLDLSLRYQERGYSASEFGLRMTREEIGSYLGLKLETVSRILSRFQRQRLLEVVGRAIRLLDRPALKRLVDHTP